MKTLFRILLLLLPWRIRRVLLVRFYGYTLHPSAWIGLAYVYPDHLVMDEGSRIGHLTVCKGLHRVELGQQARIGRGNWITGYPLAGGRHFAHLPDRDPCLLVRDHAAITNRHLIDCTERVEIGAYATVAGFQSQFLTHSIDLEHNRQHARPIEIGTRCFVGTQCVVLGGAVLPARSVLGAKALLNKSHEQEGFLYAGVPAVPVKPLPQDWKYFQRETGFVD